MGKAAQNTGDVILKPKLYDWQEAALTKWNNRSDQGMAIAAVTGAGKTRLAMEVMQGHFDEWVDWPMHHAMVTIVVPRKALMIQWREDLIEWGIDASQIGRLGGGSIKGWPNKHTTTINITTFASLSKKRPAWIPYEDQDGFDKMRHLVVVDECHNLRGAQMRNALASHICPRDATLGLSATPHPTEEASRIITNLIGEIGFTYRYAQALADGVIPPFRLNLVKLPIEEQELNDIENMTLKINRIMRDMYNADRIEGARMKAIAQNFGTQRKRIINRVRSRTHMAIRVLNRHQDRPTLVFHESTEDVDRLAQMTPHLNPAVYHSKASKGDAALQAFKDEETDHLYSCLSLTEGFNVPRVRIAIMMSGPNAPLRRIQTLGRCLRGKGNAPNEIYLFYVNHKKDLEGVQNLIESADIPPQIITNYQMEDDWMVEIPMIKMQKAYDATGREEELLATLENMTFDEFMSGFN